MLTSAPRSLFLSARNHLYDDFLLFLLLCIPPSFFQKKGKAKIAEVLHRGRIRHNGEEKKEKKERKRKMKEGKEKRIGFVYGPEGFVYINPEYAETEREKILAMTEEEAVDYLLYQSAWSIAFAKSGWKKRKSDKKVIYERKTEDTYHSDYYRCAATETELLTLVIENGESPVYTRIVTGTTTYDDGRKECEEPILEKDYGDEAINIMTEGLWKTIMEEGRENEKQQRKN